MSAKPIVACTDGSEESLRAVEWAAREAALRGAPMRIVSAAALLPRMAERQGGADVDTVADVIRAVEGPLASVRGAPPEEAEYAGAASALPRVWIAVRVNLRRVVEQVTIADIARGAIPDAIDALTEDPGAWVTR